MCLASLLPFRDLRLFVQVLPLESRQAVSQVWRSGSDETFDLRESLAMFRFEAPVSERERVYSYCSSPGTSG